MHHRSSACESGMERCVMRVCVVTGGRGGSGGVHLRARVCTSRKAHLWQSHIFL
jgi:hypothetical protein